MNMIIYLTNGFPLATCERTNAFVCVHKIGDGNTIFVILETRQAFDLIDLPMTDHGQKEGGGHVITKAIMDGHQHLIFQYWITKPELARYYEEKGR